MKNEKTNVLIIDDDPGIGEMLKTLLGFSGYRAVVSDKLLRAKENIIKNSTDIVILDVGFLVWMAQKFAQILNGMRK